MPQFSSQVIILSKSALQAHTAPDQGVLLTGKDPAAFNLSDPLRLWIIQVGVIIITTQILSLGLRKLRQPRVIAEVLGGILLGPTAFGRIPGFSQHIFPSQSIPYLSLVANIGLCLFLFIIGLEIDMAIIRHNLRLSVSVAAAGITIPFAFGAALAIPLYHHFIDASQVSYTHFMLFTGVAYSTTAFPVLCRILTELKLLDTTVGIVVLSAGVGNDIIGWTLLALSVALVNTGSGLTALWILLVCIGWTIFMLFVVRRVLFWVARSTHSIERGPTIFFMTVTILILFGSAFFTDVIGVHAIFGAFLAGIIVPRDGGLAVTLTEKLEDMVSVIFLPLYFTLSGLSTDLGLLNTGKIWAFTVSICVLAFTGKFGGCTLAARYAGFTWREAGAIGSLMSCKGLTELIVLNVGLSAGILTRLVFSMFVLEALVLTIATTPTVSYLYPPHRHTRATATGASFVYVRSPKDDESDIENRTMKTWMKSKRNENVTKRRFTVVLDKFEHLPSLLAITALLQPPSLAYSQTETSPDERSGNEAEVPTHFGALRLIELADRPSDLFKSSATDALLHTDPLIATFRTFAQLNGLPVSASLSIEPFESLATSVAEHVRVLGTQLVLVPWLPSAHSSDNPDTGAHAPNGAQDRSTTFDALFRMDRSSTSLPHTHFVRSVFAHAGTNVALVIGRVPFVARGQTHVFLPFFGGPDDRLALDFVMQLCTDPRVSATVAYITKRDVQAGVSAVEAAYLVNEEDKAEDNLQRNTATITSLRSLQMTAGFPDTMYGNATTQTRPQSETADAITWARYATTPFFSAENSHNHSGRATFEEIETLTPLHAALQRARLLQQHPQRSVMVVVGRSRRLAVEDHHAELRTLEMEHGGAVRADVRKTVGDVGTAFVMAGIDTNLLVMQASGTHAD